MNSIEPVRWMVSFWHPDGGPRDESDFPRVELWHADRTHAREEAARVLIELREERNDTRDWVAAGHPDPLEVGAGRHPGGQWILRFQDLDRGAGGDWKAATDGEEMKRVLYEARGTESRAESPS